MTRGNDGVRNFIGQSKRVLRLISFSLGDCMLLVISDALDMLDAFFSRCRVRHLSVILILLGFLFVAEEPVSAQSRQKSNPSHLRDDSEGPQEASSPPNVPDWAEPSQSRNGYSTSGRLESGVQKNVAPPGLPSDPQQLPVDGGLAFLAAAGAGYAVRKLKEEGQGEDGLPA